jgi:hypothetical protein
MKGTMQRALMDKDSVKVIIKEGVQKPLSRASKAWTETEHVPRLWTGLKLIIDSCYSSCTPATENVQILYRVVPRYSKTALV